MSQPLSLAPDNRHVAFGTTDNLLDPGGARFLTFVGLSGLGGQIGGAHLGFANMKLTAVPGDDTDGDGLPSAWETHYGLDPNDKGNVKSPGGGVVIRDRKFDSATAGPLILDTDNDGESNGDGTAFTDEVAQPGFGMHSNAFITFDLAVIRSQNNLAAGQPFRLTGEAGMANQRPAKRFGEDYKDNSAVILVDGVVAQLFDFVDEVGNPTGLYNQFGTADLMIPGTARFLTFAGVDGLNGGIAASHLGFTNMQRTPTALAPLKLLSIVRAPDGASVTLTIQSRPGRTYAVDYSTSMTATGQPGGWVELIDSLASDGDQTVNVDMVAANFPLALYRVRDVTR